MMVFAVGIVMTCMNIGNFKKNKKSEGGSYGGGFGGRRSKGLGFGGGRRK